MQLKSLWDPRYNETYVSDSFCSTVQETYIVSEAS